MVFCHPFHEEQIDGQSKLMTNCNLDPAAPLPWLRHLFDSAVEAVQPATCLPPHLPDPPDGRTLVVGAGKAAASMAQALETHWPTPLSGLAVTRYAHAVPCQQIEVLEAAHPVPDQLGVQAAQRMLEEASRLDREDLMIALISGGGSSLLALPAPGITLADKQALSKALLHSGAPIKQINIVRTHLSAVKGGRLAAAAAPARVCTLIISDVPDNDPAWVASGPTVANQTSAADALEILQRHAIDIPERVRALLERPQAAAMQTQDAPAAGSETVVIATATDALQAARRAAETAQVEVRMLGDDLEGEARALGREHARLARDVRQVGLQRPVLLLSGGETSVTVARRGRGGRNTEYLLGMALELDAAAGIHALAADTDGIDGSEDNAGAVVHPDTLRRAQAAGISAADCLAANDAYGFFASLGDLVVTGPTRTNVNDFRAILIQP